MDKMFRNSPFTGPSMKASETLRDQMNNYLSDEVNPAAHGVKVLPSVPASSNGGKGFQIFSGEYQPLVFRATRYTVAKVTFIGILSFMLFRLWREIDKKRKRTKEISSEVKEEKDGNLSGEKKVAEALDGHHFLGLAIESAAETSDSAVDKTSDSAVDKTSMPIVKDEVLDEVLWMGIDPMVICSEYRLERMEGAEEFLKCLGFSYLEIRMFLALPTNMKVEYKDELWKFTVDKGTGHTVVHEFKSGQWFVESRALGVYDCKYTFVKPFLFRFTLKPRNKKNKTVSGTQTFTDDGLVQIARLRKGRKTIKCISHFDKV